MKRKFGKVTKILKMLCPWLSKNLSLHFGTLLTAPIVINSHILAGIDLIFLKNVLDQTGAAIVINSHILTGIYLIFLKNVLDQT